MTPSPLHILSKLMELVFENEKKEVHTSSLNECPKCSDLRKKEMGTSVQKTYNFDIQEKIVQNTHVDQERTLNPKNASHFDSLRWKRILRRLD